MALYLPEEEGATWGWGTQGICCDGQKPGDLRTFALERTNLVMHPSQRRHVYSSPTSEHSRVELISISLFQVCIKAISRERKMAQW